MAEIFRDKLGVSVARVGQSYQKPYDHRFDTVPYLQGAMIPEFSNFFVESGRSTHKHVGQFLAHLGKLADGQAFHVCLFSLSLTGTTSAWYTALHPNSINSWNNLESKFHEHLFSRNMNYDWLIWPQSDKDMNNRLMVISEGSGTLETDAFKLISETKS